MKDRQKTQQDKQETYQEIIQVPIISEQIEV